MSEFHPISNVILKDTIGQPLNLFQQKINELQQFCNTANQKNGFEGYCSQLNMINAIRNWDNKKTKTKY